MEQKFVVQPDQPRDRLLEILKSFISKLPMDKPWLITISDLKRERTNKQNKALFGHAYKIIIQETGNDINDIHNRFLGDYFGWVTVEVLGHKKKKPIRTTTTDQDGKKDLLDTQTFVYFFDYVQSESALYGIDIPDPDPDWRNRMDEDIEKEKGAQNE